MTNNKMLREAPIWKLICQISLPMILIMLVQVLYNIADLFFIGRCGSYMQIAAVSLAAPVFTVISALGTLIGFGGCTAISMALGRGNMRKVQQYSSFMFWSGLFCGVLSGIVVLIALDPIVGLLGTNEETIDFTKDYLRILAIGTPASIASGALGNALRADGESKGPMLAMLIGTITNIILDPILISSMGMGIRGAALATVAGNLISFVVMLRQMRRKEGFSFSLKDLTLKPEISLKLLSYGVPMAAGTLLMSIASVFSNRILATYGNNAVAAQGVAGKAGMLIAMIIMGICIGMQPAISFNHGAGDKERVHKLVWSVGTFTMILGTVMAAGIFLMRGSFVNAFVQDPAVTGLATRMLTVSLLGAPFLGIYQIASVYLQGTGKVSYATVTSLLRQGIILVPVVLILTHLFGLTGFIFGTVASDLISTAISVVLSVKSAKDKKKPLLKGAAVRA